jgi:hypothetical protein
LREQGIHITIQQSPSVRRRGLIFDYFHALKQSRTLWVCQHLSRAVAKGRFWSGGTWSACADTDPVTRFGLRARFHRFPPFALAGPHSIPRGIRI